MDRLKLKNKAKELMRGNKWFIWKPLILFGLAIGIIEGIALGLDKICGTTHSISLDFFGTTTNYTYGGYISDVVGIFTGFASAAFAVGYAYYILSFIRGKKLEPKDIVDFMKKYWVVAFLVGLVVGLIVIVGSILLVIPGIIAAIGLMYYKEVCADNPEKKTMEIVKQSWEMTKGHKMDLFVLGLSFIGWGFLATLTLGIGYIWLVPYMTLTFALAYEEIKK